MCVRINTLYFRGTLRRHFGVLMYSLNGDSEHFQNTGVARRY